MGNPLLQPFAEPLKASQQLIQHYNDQGMVIGGIATSLLGKPRLTADIDLVLLLSVDELLDLIQTAAQAGLRTRIGDLSIRLPTASDLIILKAIAHRPKDLLDIQGIIESNADLDQNRIQFWVTQFAELLELPELWDDIAGWLK